MTSGLRPGPAGDSGLPEKAAQPRAADGGRPAVGATHKGSRQTPMEPNFLTERRDVVQEGVL